jgi:SAM-dependent methyltransferase
MSTNFYANRESAKAYAQITFPGTYFLAFRDLPKLFHQHIHGNNALDFGCGAGRSTRFLRNCGFQAVGVDIAAEMLIKARELDPIGDYQLIADGDFSSLERGTYDLVLCAFPFDNIPNIRKTALLSGLAGLMKESGKMILLGSTPEIYSHEWASFSTADFRQQNMNAREGDTVRTINLAAGDQRPVDDVLCSDETYRKVFREAGLDVLEMLKPLARAEEPFSWINETRVAPWMVYVLVRAANAIELSKSET